MFRPLLLVAVLACTVASPAADRFSPLDVRQVQVAGLIGRRVDVTVHNNLLAINVDRDFLASFKEKKAPQGYIGLGKFIDSAVRLAAVTGDAKAAALKRHLVDEALRLQEPDGYLGMLRPANRIFSLWDVHEMSYLVYGLTSDAALFGEKRSLDAARRLADYIQRQWAAQPGRKLDDGRITEHMSATGSEPAFLALYGQTHEPRYLDFVTHFRRLADWDDHIVLGRWGTIEGHAYAHMCRCVAQLRLFRLQEDPRLLGASQRVVDFLTRGDGLVITGACGDHECWHDSQAGTINLGETCASAYLIRLMDELLRLQGDPRYGDILERTMYNALFAAQSPDGRHIRYYTPFDGPRSYFKGDTYCCPCNYRRIVAELPGMVYYRAADGVLVNLYTPSTATVGLAGDTAVKLQQETDYPRDGRVAIHVSPAKTSDFTVYLRIPAWCRQPLLSVNDRKVSEPVRPGAIVSLRRTWHPGDRITVDLPMTWRLVKGRQAQAGRAAVMRGPVLYCLDRSRHAELAKADLRLVTLDPDSLQGPAADDKTHGGGPTCRLRAWGPGKWYPHGKPELTLTLTEFPDPAGEAVYFNLPNPRDPRLVDDELVNLR